MSEAPKNTQQEEPKKPGVIRRTAGGVVRPIFNPIKNSVANSIFIIGRPIKGLISLIFDLKSSLKTNEERGVDFQQMIEALGMTEHALRRGYTMRLILSYILLGVNVIIFSAGFSMLVMGNLPESPALLLIPFLVFLVLYLKSAHELAQVRYRQLFTLRAYLFSIVKSDPNQILPLSMDWLTDAQDENASPEQPEESVTQEENINEGESK